MLQNARVAAFTISELLRENQQGGRKIPLPPSAPKLGLKTPLNTITNFFPGVSIIKLVTLKFFFNNEILLPIPARGVEHIR